MDCKDLALEIFVSGIPLGDMISDVVVIFTGKMWAGTAVQKSGFFIFVTAQYFRFCASYLVILNLPPSTLEDICCYSTAGFILSLPRFLYRCFGIVLPFFRFVGVVIIVCLILVLVLLTISITPAILVFILGVYQATNEWWLKPFEKVKGVCSYLMLCADFCYSAELPIGKLIDEYVDRERRYYRTDNIWLNYWRVTCEVGAGTRALVRYVFETESNKDLVRLMASAALLEELLENIAGLMMVAEDIRSIPAIISIFFAVLSLLFESGEIFGIILKGTSGSVEQHTDNSGL